MGNFQLKSNSYYNFGNGQKLNNDKLTDTIALKLLKDDPARIRLFSKYPENWKNLIGATPKSKFTTYLTRWFK